MPLEHGKSKAAFQHNLKQEIHHGKPLKQSLAIAYSMKKKAKKMAHGGAVEALDTDDRLLSEEDYATEDSDDIVSQIMRERHMSKGGMVANDTEDGRADLESAQYDDLVNRDDLEFSYTGENSGDELSSPGEDERRDDMVAEIMRQRKMKAGTSGYPRT